MPTVRTLKTRKDGSPAGYAPGSPKWRAAGRDASKMERKAEEPAADVSDLEGKTAEELKQIAENAALRALIAQTRQPTRHATAITSAARTLLDFSSKKPAEEIDHKHQGGLSVTVTHVRK